MKSITTLVLYLIALSAFAQNPCDDLTILSVQYSPFTDTVIVVEVTNTGDEIFSYPGFVLTDSDGDTLAQEIVNYFGIGQQSVHHLYVRPGIASPLDVFTGTLELYSGFFDTFECSWQIDQSMCIAEPCDSVVLGFDNWGGALVLGDFAWSLSDTLGTEVESGTFTLTTDQQNWNHSLCVEASVYDYIVTALGQPTGGGPTMLVSSGTWYGAASISQYFEWENTNTMRFPFFLHCTENGSLGLAPEEETSKVLVTQNRGQVTFTLSEPITELVAFDLGGRRIGQWNPNVTAFTLPIILRNGLYVMQLHTALGVNTVKVVSP